MKQIFDIALAAPVWQIRIDDKHGLLAVEVRDADTLHTSFSVLDVKTGALLLSDYKTREPWYVGLEDIHQGILFFHGIGDRRFGSHKGITAVEVKTGKLLWQDPEFIYYGFIPDGLLVKKNEALEAPLSLIDSFTGKMLTTESENASSSAMPTIFAAYQANRRLPVLVPGHYPDSSAHFSTLQQFLESKINITVKDAIDYLETKDFFILGFYNFDANNQRCYRVAVFNLEGELILKEDLATNLEGLGLDNFFIIQNSLILLKNKSTLLGYGF
ncbi:DUF4905 domain-containing protein [Adhaeribacter aquaticus]|uniref:DUF4905 domain-containing protein n=1 Tax=Adhaeribacter aquaticus TaxID=299567 RepID=UPI00047EF949|nr:DUF4905 domain-containing protein [Adhaeribacter aquaticus]